MKTYEKTPHVLFRWFWTVILSLLRPYSIILDLGSAAKHIISQSQWGISLTKSFLCLFKQDDIEENSSDGSQAPKRRRMGSGDSSRSCDTSNHELG